MIISAIRTFLIIGFAAVALTGAAEARGFHGGFGFHKHGGGFHHHHHHHRGFGFKRGFRRF